MSKHTRAPWHWRLGTLIGAGGAPADTPEDRQLILAAPDLLAAAREMVEMLGSEAHTMADVVDVALPRLEAAIAKAEGTEVAG